MSSARQETANLTKFWNLWAPIPIPLINQGQIWHSVVVLWYILPCQIMGILLKPDMCIKCVFEIWALESLRMTMTVFRDVKKLSSNTSTVFLHVKNMFFLLIWSLLMLLSNAIAFFVKNEHIQDISGFCTQLHRALCGLIQNKNNLFWVYWTCLNFSTSQNFNSCCQDT